MGRHQPGWNGGLLVLAVSSVLMAVGSGRAWGDEGRFSVMGWVKEKLSPEEQARSAGRAGRLRPLEGGPPPATGLQTVAMISPPPPAPSSPSPGIDDLAGASPHLAPPPPPIPSRPVSRESVLAESLPPPAPPVRPAPAIGRDAPAEAPPPAPSFTGERTVAELRRRAEYLATRGLTYKFGGDHPSEGGMDCSGTMQFLLQSMGYPDIPRTSYDQFAWLGKQGTLKKVGFWRRAERAVNDLRPGDLVFWGGTYDSGHKVSHVMVYLGKGRGGTHYLFGARGRKMKGLNGSGVDIFEYHPGKDTDRLVGYGRLPGIQDR